jgi:dTDP-4-amino-4,6-dideoxygalactose transaminase
VTLDGAYRRLSALQPALGPALEASIAAGSHQRGECIPILERQVQQGWGIPLVLATSSGYAALCLALSSAGVKPGQEVIVPALAPASTLLAIQVLGAVPHIVDIERETLTIDPRAAQEALLGGNAAALIAPYPFGQPPNMRALMGLSAEYGLPVIEDVTDAPGACFGSGRYAGLAAGTIGHFGVVNLSYGDPLGGVWSAGLLLCRDEETREALLSLRAQWDGPDASEMAHLDGRHRIRELDALCIQLKVARLEGWQRRQSEIVARYAAAFADLGELETQPLFAGWAQGAASFPVVVHSAQARLDLASYLARQGIQTGACSALLLPAHCTEEHRARVGVLETYAAVVPSLLQLPCYAELEEEEVERVITHVQRWYALQHGA